MAIKFPEGVLQQAIDAYSTTGGVKVEAARLLGIKVSTFKHRYAAAVDAGLMPRTVPAQGVPAAVAETIETLRSELERVKRDLANAVRPHFTIRHDTVSKHEKCKGLIIPDAHDSPHLPDRRRFEWIGAHANALKPDFLESIGDFFTIDSLNQHEGNETLAGRKKPTFAEDMESGNLALAAIDSRLNWGCEKHLDEGNHERRIYAYENANPEMDGNMVFQFHKLLERYKWTHSPYGHINYRGGVGFVHAAINRLGKTFGGKNAEATIANDSVHDLVIGHSHIYRMHRAPKIGGNGYVQVLNVGCALPDGHIEHYAKHCLNGWSYGVVEVTIQHGRILDHSFISMARLEEMYGTP